MEAGGHRQLLRAGSGAGRWRDDHRGHGAPTQVAQAATTG